MGSNKLFLGEGHPNFEWPTMSDKLAAHIAHGTSPLHVTKVGIDLVEYVTEAIAQAISPPKVDGEDVEIECSDVAAMIRGPLRDALLVMLRMKYASQNHVTIGLE